MSCEEIRYYLRLLHRTPDLGWYKRTTALAHAVGLYTKDARSHLLRKLCDDCWIYPGEQLRFSKGIRQILSGKLVCVHVKGNSWGCAIAAQPVPLQLPKRMRYNLATGRLEYLATPIETQPTLPSFRDVFIKAIDEWRHPRYG
jgi:hypothetical protein